MSLEKLKKFVKSNPRLECLYMCLASLKDVEKCKEIVGVKRNPYNLTINKYGDMHSDKWIYYSDFDKDYQVNGFCSLYRFVLMHLAYADDLNMVPVVNFGRNTLYYDETITNKENAFEYFFEPVAGICSNEVFQCKKVILSKGANAQAVGTTSGYSIPEEEIEFLGKFQKKYIRLNAETKELFWDKMQNIIEGGKTLGVHVRATDFNKGYNRHPVVVTPEEYLEMTKKIFVEHSFEKVFLATDDESVIEIFKNEFGEAFVYYDDTFRSKNGEAIHYGNDSVKREHHKYFLGLEIIKDFYTLGYCDGLIAGNSNVSMCARIVKAGLMQEYRVLKIIDKGTNHNLRETRSVFKPMIKKSKK